MLSSAQGGRQGASLVNRAIINACIYKLRLANIHLQPGHNEFCWNLQTSLENLQNLDSLCARLLKARYLPNGIFLDTVFSAEASPSWRGIEHSLELLKK
jgi:hypothetical protein